jgi:ribosomal protein S19E (S16A)
MSILHKVLPKPGIEVDRILEEFSKDEIEIPYPALHPLMVRILSEELELMGYLEMKENGVYVTDKGEAKLVTFKKSLSDEEKEALNLQ